MLPLDVVASKGFAFSEYQLHGNTTRRKPGWIATAPGHSIDVRVSTLITAASAGGSVVPPYALPRQRQPPNGTAQTRGWPLQVVIGYLRSYQHMGRANVTCVKGCTCFPSTIDAHSSEKMSVLRLHELIVTPAAECVVRLEVLKESSSPDGEHKFKLLQVAVRGSAAAA